LHAGKIIAIAKITGAKVIGYGDRKQIGFIPFTRFHKPAVETAFPWGSEERCLSTRRLPVCDQEADVISWLRSDEFYGSGFETLSTRRGGVVLYAAMTTFEKKLAASWLYSAMGIKKREELVILVYTQDQAMNLRSAKGWRRELPARTADGTYDVDYPVALSTIGEAQGGDWENVLLLRLATTQEPLHDSAQQTLVALTRFKRRFGYLAVVSRFPTLVEKVGGHPEVCSSVEDVVASRRQIVVA